ncbi:MAG: phage head-tail adaptor [Variovorax sp.]|nr:phage head-tail adaptor [Variovorax sp.]
MTASGDLRDRMRFERRAVTADEYGNDVAGAFEPQFTRWAQLVPARGSEQVIASRLEGVQPVTVRVRWDSQTGSITPDWRAVDTRSGRVYAIKTAADPDRRRQWMEMLCVSGEAP